MQQLLLRLMLMTVVMLQAAIVLPISSVKHQFRRGFPAFSTCIFWSVMLFVMAPLVRNIFTYFHICWLCGTGVSGYFSLKHVSQSRSNKQFYVQKVI